ncbi:MAG TPA: hypothetical protein VHS05_12920 [Pyrinomonadaceae bacterium]|nr:hypothetical protein [Pyrinomonadaceae bacterium]
MKRVLAIESRKPALLSVMPRRTAFDSASRNQNKLEMTNNFRTPVLGHQFSSVAIIGDEVAARMPSPMLKAIRSRLFSSSPLGAPAALYEENLEGQPEPDAGAAADTSEAVPLETVDVAPMSESATGGTQTGATRCDTATGKVITATLNTNECTKDCSTKHEEKHAADIAPCCTKAGAASQAAKTDDDKAAIQTKFDNWMISNRPFLECRAYAVSISCGDAKHKRANCEKQSYGKCCKALVWYIRTATLEKTAACNNANKNLSDCPFS